MMNIVTYQLDDSGKLHSDNFLDALPPVLPILRVKNCIRIVIQSNDYVSLFNFNIIQPNNWVKSVYWSLSLIGVHKQDSQ